MVAAVQKSTFELVGATELLQTQKDRSRKVVDANHHQAKTQSKRQQQKQDSHAVEKRNIDIAVSVLAFLFQN